MNIPFVGPAYKSRSLPWSAQECVNLCLEQGGPDAKSPYALLGTPGLETFSVLSTSGGEVRGLCSASDGFIYAVCDDKFFRVSADGTASHLGNIETSSGPVSITENGVQVVVVDNPNGYVLTLSGMGFAKVASTGWPGAAMMDYLDGYGVGVTPDSNQFWPTSLYDFSTMWSELDFASAESNPDKIVGVQVDHREIWIFGTKTVEVWYNSGDSTFPFSRVSGAYIELGCAAPFSLAKLDNTQFWLGTNGSVVRAQGYTPMIVSTRAIESAISSYPRIDDARAFAYSQEGHAFYVITFPTADVTWVYDAATQSWHQRKSWGMGRWRPTCYARLDNQHIVGDVSTGKLYKISPTCLTDAGQPIERVRVSTTIAQEDKRLIHSRLAIDFETGVGTGSGQGADPKALLSWSDDGGRTWGNEHPASIGKQGEYKARAVWWRLGMSRNRVYKLRITDPVPVAILGAYGEISPGRP